MTREEEFNLLVFIIENGYELIYKRANLLKFESLRGERYQVFLEGGGHNAIYYSLDNAISAFLDLKRQKYP